MENNFANIIENKGYLICMECNNDPCDCIDFDNLFEDMKDRCDVCNCLYCDCDACPNCKKYGDCNCCDYPDCLSKDGDLCHHDYCDHCENYKDYCHCCRGCLVTPCFCNRILDESNDSMEDTMEESD